MRGTDWVMIAMIVSATILKAMRIDGTVDAVFTSLGRISAAYIAIRFALHGKDKK